MNRMSWEDARNRELAHWSAVRAALGSASPVTLLTEINAADALCEKAKDEAAGATDYCKRCLFYQQFGGCREVTGRLSELVAAGDREGARALMDEYIAHLGALEVPSLQASLGG